MCAGDGEGFGAGAGLLSQSGTCVGIAKQIGYRFGESLGIVGRDQPGAIACGVSHAADVGGNRRRAGGHRLHQRQRHAFAARGQDEEVRLVKIGPDVFRATPSGEMHHVLYPEPCDLLHE